MKKKATKKSAPAKKAVEPKLKVVKKFEKEPIVKQEERNQVKDSIPAAVKPISQAEMMEKHQVAAKKKKDEEFDAAFKKAENKLEIYFEADKDGERMDMRVGGFNSMTQLAGVLSLMLSKVTG